MLRKGARINFESNFWMCKGEERGQGKLQHNRNAHSFLYLCALRKKGIRITILSKLWRCKGEDYEGNGTRKLPHNRDVTSEVTTFCKGNESFISRPIQQNLKGTRKFVILVLVTRNFVSKFCVKYMAAPTPLVAVLLVKSPNRVKKKKSRRRRRKRKTCKGLENSAFEFWWLEISSKLCGRSNAYRSLYYLWNRLLSQKIKIKELGKGKENLEFVIWVW